MSESMVEKIFAIAEEKFGMTRREGQIKMAEIVADTLEKKIISAIEAGTGVGKSLGYLLPIYALARDGSLGKVVISTATKNLQQRLFEQDAPLAAQITGTDLKVVIMKGRNNYLCAEALSNELRREQRKRADRDPEHSLSRDAFYRALDDLFQRGEWSGELEDLPPFQGFSQKEISAWFAAVSAASDHADCRGCLHQSCPFLLTRAEASTADIIIANHHLVAADFALWQEIGFSLFSKTAPPTILIIDEAHEFSDAFRSIFISRFTLNRWARLRSDFMGFIEGLSRPQTAEEDEGGDARSCSGLASSEALSLSKLGERVDSALKDLFSLFTSKLSFAAGKGEDVSAMLLFPDALTDGDKEKAKAALNAMISYCQVAKNMAGDLLSNLVEVDHKMQKRFDALSNRCDKILGDFERAVMLKHHYRTAGDSGDACSFDGRAFIAQPVMIANELRQLWSAYSDGVVLTSATLFPRPKMSGGKWFRGEFGLSEDAVLRVVPSVFRYEEQMEALLFANEELLPTSPKRAQTLVGVILRAAEKKPDGGILVLFTSFSEMKRVAALLAPLLPDDRLLLVQGQSGSRTQIIQQYKEHGKGILLGVDSFWQGVDIPGDALSVVLISKLPFPVPNDPVIEAKITLAGKKDGWQKVCKPLCALKLQQGIGRLIRAETDKGLVLLCDPRVLKKHKQFLSAFPVQPKCAIFEEERGQEDVAIC